jgi:hypothetical protein
VRHQANHKANSLEGGSSPDRSAERAHRACDACVKSKLKCGMVLTGQFRFHITILTYISGNVRPCKRCEKRGIPCSSDSLEQVTFSADRIEDGNSASSQPLQSVPSNTDRIVEAYNVEDTIPAFDSGGADLLTSQDPSHGIAPLTSAVEPWPQLEFDLSMPSFFESIMVPDWVGAGEVQMPPDLDLTGVTPDYEEWPGTGDIFGFDFSTAFEQAMDTTNKIDGTIAPNDNDATNLDRAAAVVVDPPANSARQRHDIFQRSPW